MKTDNRVIIRKFKKYRSLKKDEFTLLEDKGVYTFIATKQEEKKINIIKNVIKFTSSQDRIVKDVECVYSVFDDEIIEKLNPNNIDSGFFWKKAVETFPLASILNVKDCEDRASINEASIKQIHLLCGALSILDNVFENNPSAKILEIGPGYGSITNYIALNHNLKNYYAIDVNPMFEFKRLYKTDGKTISPKVPNDLDIVYSINVFQHLSPEQRLSYYKQIKEKLIVGGKFVFSMFVVDEITENIKLDNGAYLFGMRDKEGNCYTNFFSQLTRCSRIEELQEIFKELEMELEIINIGLNHYTMCATKK